MKHRINRLIGAVAAGMSLTVAAEERPQPAFQNTRYDDDLATRQAALYYMPLRLNDASELSVGGQIRVRGERWDNFGFTEANDDEFLLLRLRLHTDLRVCSGFRVFVEGIGAQATERDLPGGRRTVDADSADLLNAFGDLSTDIGEASLTLRGGRQELQYGKQRLVSPLDWANTRRTFDGVKFIAKSGDWRVDAFLARLVQVQKYAFNSGDSGRDLYGVYATRKIASWQGAADAYWLSLDRDDATFGAVTGEEKRETLGARLGGACGVSGVDYDLEGGCQFGDVAGADIRAFFFASQVGYKPPDFPMNPRLYMGYDYASGDDDPADGEVETFNQLFPLGHAYFGALDVVGRQNVTDISAGVTLAPLAKLSVKLEGHLFERADTHDALYDVGGNVTRAGDTGSSRDIGREINLITDYKWNARLLLQAGYGHFFAGDFIEESGASEDVDLAYVMAQYTL